MQNGLLFTLVLLLSVWVSESVAHNIINMICLIKFGAARKLGLH